MSPPPAIPPPPRPFMWSVLLASASDLRETQCEERAGLVPRLGPWRVFHLFSQETVSPAPLKDADEE